MVNVKIKVLIKHLKVEADIDYEGTYDDDVRAGIVAMLAEIITPTVIESGSSQEEQIYSKDSQGM